MASIPGDVIPDILLKLPVKSFFRFKCVSKEWYNMINELDIERSRLIAVKDDTCIIWNAVDSPSQLTKIKFPWKFVIVGSSNGLLCLREFVDDEYESRRRPCTLWICNPSTLTVKRLDCYDPWRQNPHVDAYYSYGFGYDSQSNDYKIVATNGDGNNVIIYSLKTDLWISKPEPFALRKNCYIPYYKSLKNRLHALVREHPEHQLVCFNLSTERWENSARLPYYTDINDLGKGEYIHILVNLGVLKDSLCVNISLKYGSSKSVEPNCRSINDIWIMKDYGIHESWTKLATITAPMTKSVPILHCFESDRQRNKLVLPKENSLLSYDMDDDTIEEVEPYYPFSYDSTCLISETLETIPGSSQTVGLLEREVIPLQKYITPPNAYPVTKKTGEEENESLLIVENLSRLIERAYRRNMDLYSNSKGAQDEKTLF